MIVKTLLALHGAPYFDILLDEPLHHKGRFIVLASQAVKHEYQQNIKFSLQGHLLYLLNGVPVLGGDLDAGNALLGKFLDDFPSGVLFAKLPAILLLHGDVVLFHLSHGGHPVQTDNTLFDCLDGAFGNTTDRLDYLLCHIYFLAFRINSVYMAARNILFSRCHLLHNYYLIF